MLLPEKEDKLKYELAVCKLIAPIIESFIGTESDLCKQIEKHTTEVDFEYIDKDLRTLIRTIATHTDFVP